MNFNVWEQEAHR